MTSIKYRIVQDKITFVDSGKALEFSTYELAEDYILNVLFTKYSFGEWQIEKVFVKS